MFLAFVTMSPPLLAIGCALTEVCAERVSISKAKQTDTPDSPGFRQTINESTHITAV